MIRIFFGNIGCGKTTTAVRNSKKFISKGNKLIKKINKTKSKKKRLKLKNKIPYFRVYSNFDNSLTKFSNLDGLGEWTFPVGSLINIDEAGIQYNNRKYKTLPQSTIEWFKLSRHYGCDIDIYSQSFEDMDITLRRLASEYWYIKNLGPFTMLRRIYKFVTIDENTHQIIDGYKFGSILSQLLPFPFHRHTISIFLRKPYYKYFDSFSTPDTPVRK